MAPRCRHLLHSRTSVREIADFWWSQGSAVRNNGIDEEFVFIKESKLCGIHICSEERRESIGVEDVRCLQVAMSTLNIIP